MKTRFFDSGTLGDKKNHPTSLKRTYPRHPVIPSENLFGWYDFGVQSYQTSVSVAPGCLGVGDFGNDFHKKEMSSLRVNLGGTIYIRVKGQFTRRYDFKFNDLIGKFLR